MGAIQTTNNHHRKRYRAASSTKSTDQTRYKRTDQFRTTMRSATLRALTTQNYPNSISSSSYESTFNNNNNSLSLPTTITTINSQSTNTSDPYLSDFDYRKLSTLTGLTESKINELHREFLILSDNGRLTFEKYKSMLEILPDQKDSKQLDQLARRTFNLFDKDGNNYLDFAEFIAAYIIMEKKELSLVDESQMKSDPTPTVLTSVTRQPVTYYSPTQTLVNASPIVSSRTTTTYLPTKYTSYYYQEPQAIQRYVYRSPHYSYR